LRLDVLVASRRFARGPRPILVAEINPLANGRMVKQPDFREPSGPEAIAKSNMVRMVKI
jgi:hypothetical protein